ncbi:outer membrane lipid asymmetry maintenance protein MlaD [Alphaproteobacteria bacterium]|nr:outer membrane lipid asymmetry maintenance protein MlaD [Alphaproteobacteria bacterium]
MFFMISKNNNYFDFIVGTFVLFCAAIFFFTSFNSSSIKTSLGYELIAKFDNANGISSGSDVKISGVKVGTVITQSIDENKFRAILKFSIDNKIKLPVDSSAKIVSDGLLGSKYLEINPGSQEDYLKEGDEISFTQSSVNFEELLAKFMFSSKTKED